MDLHAFWIIAPSHGRIDNGKPGPSAALIYELHVGTFTPEGTFRAAIDKLDHLIDLGATHIELMPVAESSGTHG